MGCINVIRSFIRKNVTVEPVIFIYMSAIFMEMSIVQDLMKTKLCLQNLNVTDYHECYNLTADERHLLTGEIASWAGYYSMIMFLFAFITTAYIGSWSDRFSRKIPMFIPTVGSVVAVITLLMNSMIMDLHIGWILLSGAISGITGGIIGIAATTFGYIADITTEQNRTVRVVILEANLYIGGTLGMIIGGLIHKKLLTIPTLPIPSYSVIFFIELGLLILSIAYIYFKVEELPRPVQPDTGPSQFYKLFNLNHIKECVATTLKRRENNGRLYIFLILLVTLLVGYALSVQSSLNFSYLSGEPLRWTQTDYSYYTALNFGLAGLCLITGMPVFFHFLSLRDTTVALLGVASKMAGLILLGISTTDTMVYLTPALYLFSEFSIPALRSILSKLVGDDEKGKIFALMQLIQNLSLLTGSQIFNPLFRHTYQLFAGLCYEIVAGLQGVAIVILLFVHIRRRPSEIYREMTTDLCEGYQVTTKKRYRLHPLGWSLVCFLVSFYYLKKNFYHSHRRSR